MNKSKLLIVTSTLLTAINTSPVFAHGNPLYFSGYARFGAHYAAEENRYVEIGSTGVAAGRLGNEGNGGEFQFARPFEGNDNTVWDLVVMFNHWQNRAWDSSGGVDLSKAYAGVANLFESQPDLYLWAGRNFNQRVQTGLNDYYWIEHDGQGGGFYNLDFGGIKLDMSVVGQIDADDGLLGNDNGIYAVTSKIHGLDLGIGPLDLYTSYGFASDEADESKKDETAWQVGATLGMFGSSKLVARYSDGADASVFDLRGDFQSLYTSIDGSYDATDSLTVEYLASYKVFSGDDAPDKQEYSAIIRPMYSWNDTHSTWFEGGYALEDFDDGSGEARAWKATISQNISLGGRPSSRPMLRLYATVGDVVDTSDEKHKTLSAGVMFESWW
ncbi:carbohydrate porin [Vibrio sp. WXL103]|uniref:carbohydrate porin n=1 Tax=Vibrio sp. WXL103 TaxID=3450710 RepID=UPI003EC53910